MAASLIQRFLDQPILERGISNPTFVNGRILTAQDLTDLQTADQAQHAQLGQALGDGVAWGLEAALVADGSDGQAPVVRLSPGLAINRLGQAIALSVGTDIALAAKPPPTPTGTGLFDACKPPGASSLPLGPSVLLLVASPGSGYREKAPVLGFNDGTVSGCGDRYAVEGVRLRTEELKLSALAGLRSTTLDALTALTARDDNASLSQLRNWLAHVCFGTEELAEMLRDPFVASDGRYGAIDALRAAGSLSDCEVPLALIYWTRKGVRFLDQWAVRRRLTRRPAATDWPLVPNDRQASEGEAMLLQFQDQIEAILGDPTETPTLIRASERFVYLPPVGMIALMSGTSARGFHPDLFFEGIVHRPIAYLEGARLGMLLRMGLSCPAQALASGVMVWVYRVRESADPKATPAGKPGPHPYLVFGSGHLPYLGDPHFDVNRWDYSNWA
jgi:hypothetical protein